MFLSAAAILGGPICLGLALNQRITEEACDGS